MTFRSIVHIILLLFLVTASSLDSKLLAQENEAYSPFPFRKASLEFNGYFGSVFKHTKEFDSNIGGPTYSFELGMVKNCFGNKPWEKALNYPSIGASFIFTRFGNNQTFGNAYAAMPHISFYVYRSTRFTAYLRFGLGFAYLSKKYDYVENPDNNAIGSKLNAVAQFKLGMDWRFSDRFQLSAGLGLVHYSNANVQKPNLGLNLLSANIGLKYDLFEYADFDPKRSRKLEKPDERNGIMIKFSLAIRELHTTGGPKYPIYITTLQYSYLTSKVNRILAGFIYSVDHGIWEELKDRQIGEETNQKTQATEFSLYVGDEILVGKVGLYGLLGVYMLKPRFSSAPIFTKWGVNYYVYSLPSKDSISFFLGLSVKTHYFVAQYLETSVGVTF